jgi:hypothetical protein
MTNRQYEESYPEGKLWCSQGRHMRPIDHFELGGEKPSNHRQGGVDWWRAFAVSGPCGMHDEPHFGPRDTLETAARKWLHAVDDGELDVAPTAAQLRDAIRSGRVVVNNKYTGPYVVALPWEQSAFCKDCRTVLEVRERIAAHAKGTCSSAELEELIRARRRAQYHGLCWLCRQGTARQLVHVYDVEPGIDNYSPHDGWVLVCDDCDRTLHAYHGLPDEYLANHVTDYPGVDHTVLKLEDPPLRDELPVRSLFP